MEVKYDFFKNNPKDKIYWVDNVDVIGEHLFIFDRKRIFNLFKDFLFALTEEQRVLFEQENPYWADFFKDRARY